jgi:hypothetical protein
MVVFGAVADPEGSGGSFKVIYVSLEVFHGRLFTIIRRFPAWSVSYSKQSFHLMRLR